MNVMTRPDQFTGFTGTWLQSAHASAFIALRPYLRVLSFAPAGHASPLFVSRTHEYFGIRSWFMEPEQTAQSGGPALQPARIVAQSKTGLTAVAERDPETGLILQNRFELLADRPALRIRHSFVNDTGRTRIMAPWAIVALQPDWGRGAALWPSGPRRSLTVTAPGRADDPILVHGPAGLEVDFSRPPEGAFLKVGLDTDAGWVAAVGLQHSLVSRVAHQPGMPYPEGGGTVTFFRSASLEDGAWAEIENLGPLRRLMPSEAATLDQLVEFLPGTAGQGVQPWLKGMADA